MQVAGCASVLLWCKRLGLHYRTVRYAVLPAYVDVVEIGSPFSSPRRRVYFLLKNQAEFSVNLDGP
jgi:hypothetical protein